MPPKQLSSSQKRKKGKETRKCDSHKSSVNYYYMQVGIERHRQAFLTASVNAKCHLLSQAKIHHLSSPTVFVDLIRSVGLIQSTVRRRRLLKWHAPKRMAGVDRLHQLLEASRKSLT